LIGLAGAVTPSCPTESVHRSAARGPPPSDGSPDRTDQLCSSSPPRSPAQVRRAGRRGPVRTRIDPSS